MKGYHNFILFYKGIHLNIKRKYLKSLISFHTFSQKNYVLKGKELRISIDTENDRIFLKY